MKRLLRREFVLLTTTAFAVAVFVTASWWVFGHIEAGHKAEVRAALQTVLETSHQAFLTWAREERAAAKTWAEAPEVLALTQELLERLPTREALLAAPDHEALRVFLARVRAAKGYEGYFIISPEGVNLSSTRDANTGVVSLLTEQPEVLAALWAGETALSLPQRSDVPLDNPSGALEAGRPTMFVGAPIVGADGVPIAVLVFRLNPFRDFTALFQRGRIGRTGETYAFDGLGRLISESRFDEQLREIGLIGPGERALLNIEIRDPTVNLLEGQQSRVPAGGQQLTAMAASAISGKSGFNVDGYNDYRGVPVVGVWLWDARNRFGIATEIDRAEAKETLVVTWWMGMTLTAIAGVFMVGLAALFVVSQRRITASAEQLEEALTRALSGYLPICARCKKIRDDSGEWQSVEDYVGERTAVSFTHGICPECGESLYGDLWTRAENSNRRALTRELSE